MICCNLFYFHIITWSLSFWLQEQLQVVPVFGECEVYDILGWRHRWRKWKCCQCWGHRWKKWAHLVEVHCKNFKLHGFRAANPCLIMAFLVCRQDMVRRNSSFCILPSLLSLLRLDELGQIAGISGNNTHQLSWSLPCYIALCCCDEATHSAMGSKAVETGLVCGNGPELDGNS